MKIEQLEDLHEGLELEIIKLYNNIEIVTIPLKSNLTRVVDNSIFIISTVKYYESIDEMEIRSDIEILFVYGDNAFKFKAKVLAKEVNSNDDTFLRLIKTSPFEKTQRRDYYRYECVLDTKYRVIDKYENQNDVLYKDAIVLNLSGGGLCMSINSSIEIEQSVECILRLYKEIRVSGKVVWLSEKQKINNCKEIFYVGILFLTIKSSVRNDIIKYIYKEQRKLLSKMSGIAD